jgi:hypothetical protein
MIFPSFSLQFPCDSVHSPTSPITNRQYTAGYKDEYGYYRWREVVVQPNPKRMGKDTFLYSASLLHDGRTVQCIGRVPTSNLSGFSNFQVNIIHNDKGAAIYSENRDFFMYMIDGKLHRSGGQPAIIDRLNNHYEYWEDGKLHRLGGPAIEHGSIESGTYQFSYFIEGKLHRVGGPAIMASTGYELFALADRILTPVQHLLETNTPSLELIDRVMPLIKTNKDIRLVKNAMKRAGYKAKEAERFEQRLQLLKRLVI